MFRYILGCLFAGLLLTPGAKVAPQEPRVRPGERVRVTVPSLSSERLVGTVRRADADSWILDVDGRPSPVSVPATAVTRLEVSRGRRSRPLEGAGLGILLLGGIGAGYHYTVCRGEDDCHPMHATLAVAGGSGALLGLLVGAAIKTDRWDEVSMGGTEIAIALTDTRTLDVSIALPWPSPRCCHHGSLHK